MGNIARILQTLIRRNGASVTNTAGTRPWRQRPQNAPQLTSNASAATPSPQPFPNLTDADKKFLSAVKDVRGILKLEEQKRTTNLDSKQEEKLLRKDEALKELAEYLDLLPVESPLRERSRDVFEALLLPQVAQGNTHYEHEVAAPTACKRW